MQFRFVQAALRQLKAFVRKPLILITVAIATLITIPLFSVLPLSAAPNTKIQFVPPAWVAQNTRDPNLRVLDVRNAPLDYVAGHVPNSVNVADIAFRGPQEGLPVQYWEPSRLADILTKAGVTDKSRVLVYSDARDVLGATMVAYLLERSGLRGEVAVLDGGYTGYKESQPVAKEYPKYKPGKFTLRDNPAVRVTVNQVKGLIGKPGVAFVDPRPAKLFTGEENLWVRNGHIPGARNIPWPTFMDANNPHKLKALSEIKAILADKKITPDKDVIVTCSTGREATLQYIVLKHLLGYPKVRIYEGSWTEYSITDLPVETGPEKVAQL